MRAWRERRRLSQMELALEADVSARHVSFIETGRARPSPEMILRLATQLDVPLRQRNRLLLAAGYAPAFEQYEFDAPEMEPVRRTIQSILDGHDPYPALVVDGTWELLASNRGMGLLIEGVSPELLEPPTNVYRLALHPDGIAPRIVNLGECRDHLLKRLERQFVLSGDPSLKSLLDEVTAYPGPALDGAHDPGTHAEDGSELAVPVRLRHNEGEELTFISTLATFGAAVEVTASELSIESFFPLDERTAEVVREYVAHLPPT